MSRPVLLATAAWVLSTTFILAETDDVTDPGLLFPDEVGPEPSSQEAPGADAAGFTIKLDGAPARGDKKVARLGREVDLALQKADVKIKYDGLEVKPRLDLTFIDAPDTGFEPGQTVHVQSALNYPFFVARAELRVSDLAAIGGPRLLRVIEIAPNGRAQFTLPDGQNLIIVHRVYDAKGRFDETHPLSLKSPERLLVPSDVEEGRDRTARRRIPVTGGSVTIYAEGLRAGEQLTALGERLGADQNGKVVVQRILPAGRHQAHVQGARVDLVRQVEIPKSDVFYVGTADLTFGRRSGDLFGDESYQQGRLSFYVDGKRADGTRITASLDTGEEDLSDIFRRLDERDPRNTLRRVDVDDLYPTYGDDSTLENNAPTSGKFYLRVERAGNYLAWGDTEASLNGGSYVRNERRLYGASARWASPDLTEQGEPRVTVSGYAAQPAQLRERDVFQATGGSVFFLSRQNIALATEAISVQVRDRISGRVLNTRRLEVGRDYDINAVQGVVTLSQPLSSDLASSGVVVTDPSGDTDVSLIVQYEFTPTSGDVEDFAFGGRAEAWVTDRLRFGVTMTSENTEAGDQRAYGADLRYTIGEDSYVLLDYARSSGPGLGANLSSDGGLVFDSETAAAGDGQAARGEVHLRFADIGVQADGVMGAYAERRSQGFSTLDYQVTAATGGERLWGVYADVAANDTLRLLANFDSYKNDAGQFEHVGEVSAEFQANPQLKFAAGLEHVDRNRGARNTGRRTDLGVRVTHAPSEQLSYYAFGQVTLARDGLQKNNRLGVGGRYALTDRWSVEGEVSDGSLGVGAQVIVSYDDENGNTLYAGYELDPGRDVTGIDLAGRDGGRYIAGATQKFNNRLSGFVENSYDLFGAHRSLTSAYGLTYTPRDSLSFTGALEIADVRDSINGDFERHALSLGVRQDQEDLSMGARLEYRRDTGTLGGTPRDGRTLLVTGDLSYKIDEERRILASFEASKTNSDGLIPEGDFVDLSFGYAYRPIDNDRLNMLFRYRFLYDTFGQLIDGSAETGPIQRSHVFSIDGIYELNDRWELGAKIGGRLSESAERAGLPLSENDAVLAIANARWHVMHNWDALIELRSLHLLSSDITETGVMGVVYRHLNDNWKLGIGHNFTSFSDDLTDLRRDDQGSFINILASF